MDQEEKSRESLAVSAWRKCLFLDECSNYVQAEGRYADAKKPGEKLMKAMSDDGVATDGWNVDTLTRYLQVGTRLAAQKVRKWLSIWDFFYKRNTFIDTITMLRACIGATTDDEELSLLILIVFLDQRRGLKKTMKADAKKSPSPPIQSICVPNANLQSLKTALSEVC